MLCRCLVWLVIVEPPQYYRLMSTNLFRLGTVTAKRVVSGRDHWWLALAVVDLQPVGVLPCASQSQNRAGLLFKS